MNILNPVTVRTADAAFAAKARKEKADADYREAIEALAELVGNEPGTYNAGGFIFNVAENNVYDASVMESTLKPGQVQRCSKRVLDKAVVKRLYPDAYEAAKDTRGVKVTLR